MKTQQRPIGPDTIATAAYYEWLKAGQPTGRDQEFWLAAEAQLRRQFQSAASPVPASAPTSRKITRARAQ